MPLYYLFSLEELEPRSPGDDVFLVLLRWLLAARAICAGRLVTLAVGDHPAGASSREGEQGYGTLGEG